MYDFLVNHQTEIVYVSRILTFMICCGLALSVIIAIKLIDFGAK